jgi:hypothetical protein
MPAPAAPVTAAQPATPEGSGNGLALAGLAGILALGGVAIAASRRRRRVDEDEVVTEMAPEPRFAAEPAETVTATYEPAIAPLAAEPVPPSTYVPAATVAAGVGAAALATGRVPETAEGRAELLDRMTRAEPDEANPFRSPKARRRRARLIMQGMVARQERQSAPARSEVRSGSGYDWNSLRPASAPTQPHARQYEDA